MPEHTAAHQTPVAKELERRLRRRARRASILRRRVGALTISLFLVSWGAIYGGGYLGVAGAKALRVTTTAARGASAKVDTGKTSGSSGSSAASGSSGSSGSSDSSASSGSSGSSSASGSDTSNGSSATSTATSVTTRQS